MLFFLLTFGKILLMSKGNSVEGKSAIKAGESAIKARLEYGGRDWMGELMRRHSHYQPEWFVAIKEYVEQKLADQQFKNNPQKFMADWKRARGGTEELRIPEDPARELMTEMLAHAANKRKQKRQNPK